MWAGGAGVVPGAPSAGPSSSLDTSSITTTFLRALPEGVAAEGAQGGGAAVEGGTSAPGPRACLFPPTALPTPPALTPGRTDHSRSSFFLKESTQFCGDTRMLGTGATPASKASATVSLLPNTTSHAASLPVSKRTSGRFAFLTRKSTSSVCAVCEQENGAMSLKRRRECYSLLSRQDDEES